MCQRDNLKNGIYGVSIVRVLVALYLLGVGGRFTSDIRLHQAYGTFFKGIGAGLILVGLTQLFFAVFLVRGAMRHNTFALFVSAIADISLFLIQYILGTATLEPTYALYEKDLQLDCLKSNPERHSVAECQEFLEDDRTAAFRLLWRGYFDDAIGGQTTIFQLMFNLQKTGSCCGFGPPLRCREIDEPFPSGHAVGSVATYLTDQQQLCGDEDDYFPRRKNCKHIVDITVVPQEVGGCRYDLGIADCLDKEVDELSRGCASEVEDMMEASIAPHGSAIIGLGAINLTLMFMACCLCWKRKYTDVWPAYLKEPKPFDPYAAETGSKKKGNTGEVDVDAIIDAQPTDADVGVQP